MKRTISVLVGMALVCALCVMAASAQTPAKVVNGGLVNGKAVSLPKPEYPEAARAAGLSAAISVNVTIDESGMVISAEADPYDQRERRDADGNKLDPVEADPSLREVAEKAARLARFSPTLLSGQPVQVKGRIQYNFVADKVTTISSNSGQSTAILTKVDDSDAHGARLTAVGIPKNVNGGVLNGKATELPAPSYPAAARAVRAEGTVVIQILISEGGSVIDAAAVSGHPLLRAAAEKAARDAKFEPTYLSGTAIKVSGILTYNFVLPKKEDQE